MKHILCAALVCASTVACYPHDQLVGYQKPHEWDEVVYQPEKRSRFTYVERIPGDGSHQLGRNAPKADYNAVIAVVPNQSEINKVLPPSPARLTADEHDRIVSLAKVVARRHHYLGTKRADDAETAPGPKKTALDAELQGAFANLKTVYDAYAALVPPSEKSPTGSFAASTDIFSGTDIAHPKLLEDSLRGQVQRMRDRLREASIKGYLNIEAYVRSGKQRTRVHVDPYDDILNAGGAKPVIEGYPVAEQAITTAAAQLDDPAPAAPPAVPAPAVPAAVAPVPADHPAVGLIDLSTTPFDRHTTLEIQESFTPNVPTSPAQPGGAAPVSTRIGLGEFKVEGERLDVSYKIVGSVIFVNQLGTLSGNKKKNPDVGRHSTTFAPAPAASLSMHYRPRVDSDCRVRDGFWNAWNGIDPALGLSVSALNLSNVNSGGKNAGLEVGLAVQASFFDDVLQVGYGYDLQAHSRPQFWYVGISVFDALNTVGKLGLNTPGAGK